MDPQIAITDEQIVAMKQKVKADDNQLESAYFMLHENQLWAARVNNGTRKPIIKFPQAKTQLKQSMIIYQDMRKK